MANEIKAKQNGSVALFGNDLQKGFENMTQEDMALPFIRILGQLSPQVTDGDSKYVEGAKPGMIYNTVTSEVQVLLWLHTHQVVRLSKQVKETALKLDYQTVTI